MTEERQMTYDERRRTKQLAIGHLSGFLMLYNWKYIIKIKNENQLLDCVIVNYNM